MNYRKLTELDLAGRRVLIRQDLNVPLAHGRVASAARIEASLPTIRHAANAGARVLLMSHLGRPVEGRPDPQYSLAPVAEYLSAALGHAVNLVTDYLETAPQVEPGQVVLLENVRFNPGEKNNDAALAKQYAALCDVYVMDAFGTAHRAQASTRGVGLHAPVACAGPLLDAELEALGVATSNPARPVVAVVGGAKVSTKLTLLESLGAKVDRLIPGGGIANTFIAAAGHSVGGSLYEAELVERARELMDAARRRGGEIPVPEDVVVGESFSADSPARVRAVSDVADGEMIFDVGPRTVAAWSQLMAGAGTIIWNGPLGVFEFERFGDGTQKLGQAIADSSAYSIAGGGDTLAAIEKYRLADHISCISTGGGAFLEFLQGETLPAVKMLEERGR